MLEFWVDLNLTFSLKVIEIGKESHFSESTDILGSIIKALLIRTYTN